MKTLLGIIVSVIAAAVITSCSDTKARYVDLNTGEPVELVKDEQTGLMVNAETNKPVRMYVDTKTHDTVWGKTGVIINGSIRKSDDGSYVYIDADSKIKTDEDGSYKVKDDDYKKKVDEDGDVKIKNGDTKVKIDGETGEKKVKKDD
jgi:hypothetical protein